MPDRGEQLFKALSSNPKYKNIGSDYTAFRNFFADDSNAEKLYSALSKDNNFKNIGKDVTSFIDYFGLKKKENSGQDSTNGSATSVTPSATSPQPEIKTGLGLVGNKKTGIGSTLINVGGFKTDITNNLTGVRTASEKQLDDAMGAFSNAQGVELSDEINTFSNNKPQETVQIDTENVGSRPGYIGNKLLQGIGSLANGLIDIGLNAARNSPAMVSVGNDAVIGAYRKQIAPQVRDYLKNKIGFEVDKGAEKTYDNEFLTSAIGGLAQSAPAMLTGYSGLLLQGYDFGQQAIQNADPDGLLDEQTKTIYASGLGLVTSALEKVGLDKVMKGNTTILSSIIFNKAVRDATKKASGKVTGDILEQYIDLNLKGLTKSFAKGGARAVEAFIAEFGTGASQEVAAIASEDLLNKATGKTIFDTSKEQTWDGFLGRVGYAGAQEGVGGFIMGGGGHILNEGRKKLIKEKAQKVSAIDDQLDNPSLSEPATELLARRKIELQDELESESEKEVTEQGTLSPEALKRAGEIDDDINNAETALADPELLDELRPEIEGQIKSLNEELADVVKNGKDKTPSIKPNDLVNYTDENGNVSQVPVESVEGETIKIGVNRNGMYETIEVNSDQVTPVSNPVIQNTVDSEEQIAKEAKQAEADMAANNDPAEFEIKMEALDARAKALPKADPIEIGGYEVTGEVESVGGERVFTVTDENGNERFLTADGKELLLAKSKSNEQAPKATPITEEVQQEPTGQTEVADSKAVVKAIPVAEEQPTTEVGEVAPTPVSKVETKPEVSKEENTPKKKRKTSSRTKKAMGNDPRSFREAAMQFFLGGGKVSTEDFIRFTGFKKGSNELRNAKFFGMVADRAKGGSPLDIIVQDYIPEEFNQDTGNILTSEIANMAANEKKADMLKELEKSNKIIYEDDMSDEEKFYYGRLTDEERAIVDQMSSGELADEEINALAESNFKNPDNDYLENIHDADIVEEHIDSLSDILDEFTDSKGNIDWDLIEQKTGEAGLSNLYDIYTIKNDNEKATTGRPEQGSESQTSTGDTSSKENSKGSPAEQATATFIDARVKELEGLIKDQKSKIERVLAGLSKGNDMFAQAGVDDGKKNKALFNEATNTEAENIKRITDPLNAELDRLTAERDDLIKNKDKMIAESANQQQMFNDQTGTQDAKIDSDGAIGDMNRGGASSPNKLGRVNNSDQNANRKRLPGQRIAVKVIETTVKKPKKLSDIVKDAAEAIKAVIAFSNPKKGRVLGFYRPANRLVSLQKSTDLDTLSHELGHLLDDEINLYTELRNGSASNAFVLGELNDLSQFGSKPHKSLTPNKKAEYRLREGIAELIRAYIVNPDQARAKFPYSMGIFEDALKRAPEQFNKAIETLSDDIITWANTNAHEQINANIRWSDEAKAPGLFNWFIGPGNPTTGDFNLTFMDKVKRDWANSLAPLFKASELAKDIGGVGKIKYENDPEYLTRIFAGINGKIHRMLTHGLTDGKMNVVTDNGEAVNLTYLFRPFEGMTTLKINEEIKESTSWMVAKRTLELAKRFNRNDLLTGIGAGLVSDKKVAERRVEEMDQLKIDEPLRYQRLKEAARRYEVFTDALLRYAVEKGRITPFEYQNIKENNLQYVALSRIKETSPGVETEGMFIKSGNGVGLSKDIVNKIKGSVRTIKDPYASLIDLAFKEVRESDRNEVMSSFVDLLEASRGMGQGDVKNLASIGYRVDDTFSGDYVNIFRNGIKEKWAFNPDIYKTIKDIDKLHNVNWIFGWYGKVLRWTVTHYPVFLARNVVRDTQQRAIISGPSIKDYMKDAKIDDLFSLYGGSQSSALLMRTENDYYKELNKSMRELASDPKKNMVINIGNWAAGKYESFLEGSELVNRKAEFRKRFKEAKDQGMDDYNSGIFAAYHARDLMDFAVAGRVMRIVNMVIPFSNAQVQGLIKSFKTAKENPAGFATRLVLYSVIPELIFRTIIHLSGDDEEYEQLPAWRRDLFYNFKMGELWISIPKPFDVGLISAAFNRTYSALALDQKNTWDGFLSTTSQILLPIDQGTMTGPMRPFIEMMTNYDTFRDKNIVPAYEEKLAIDMREGKERASRLSKGMSEVTRLFNKGELAIDPRYIDHGIKSTFSYFGDAALRISDIGKDDSRYEWTVNQAGFSFKNNISSYKDIQYLIKQYTELGQNSTKEFKEYRDLLSAHEGMESGKDKEILGKYLVAVAKQFRENFENSGRRVDKIENIKLFKEFKKLSK